MWKISMFKPDTGDTWKCAVWLSLWDSRCTACFPLVMFLHEDLALLQLSRSKSHNKNRASDPEGFSRSVILINVQHTVIKSHLIYTSICTKIKLHTTSSLREDTSFTQKWNEIYLFSLIPYVVILRMLMQLVSIQSSKKGQKHHWSTKIVVHMSCAQYEFFWRHTIALYEEQTEILLFIENVSQALECHSSFHIWIFCAVFDCDKCQNLAQGFSDVKPGSLFLNVCAK